MSQRSSLALVLAAGQGTRMKSSHPKVLHEIAGRSMLGRVMETARESGLEQIAVVVAPGMDAVRDAAEAIHPDVGVFVQEEQLGTAHAVLAAREALADFSGDAIILYGDTPLLRPQTVRRILNLLGDEADLAVLGFEAQDPTGYGRLITDADGTLVAVREEKDATDEERKVRLCNSGVFAFRGEYLPGLLERIGNDNAKGEYYLTDAVEIARADGLKTGVVVCPEEEVMGVNSKVQLAEAEAELQNRLRREAMEAGVTLLAPETVFLCPDTCLGRDVVVEQNVVFGPGVTVEEGARIRAFSHLEEAHVGRDAVVGPFARLRPGTQLGPKVRVGNFVEVKNATMDEGSKANHLTYVGDAHVGAAANIGAGTITCNYDGFQKHRTEIGAGAFIGSNTALVAPIRIGDGVYVGSGSVLSKDVPADALVVTRGPLDQRDGWAARVRTRRQRAKGNKP
ncbi:MAG: bifunctional UDP-N-acetylglucosamine diphosphorylase/glucosamine-1-phosphate N-acetyltransferase GlmU [Hyphomicrobiaceae bacterium]|nr:bifunctional UDP-N-acetylglucosamine diphosphorylase/glucosamine-1-phosphate N-acetyltransferase GlmU [Hyphomicrobiaceae bacterium]